MLGLGHIFVLAFIVFGKQTLAGSWSVVVRIDQNETDAQIQCVRVFFTFIVFGDLFYFIYLTIDCPDRGRSKCSKETYGLSMLVSQIRCLTTILEHSKSKKRRCPDSGIFRVGKSCRFNQKSQRRQGCVTRPAYWFLALVKKSFTVAEYRPKHKGPWSWRQWSKTQETRSGGGGWRREKCGRGGYFPYLVSWIERYAVLD